MIRLLGMLHLSLAAPTLLLAQQETYAATAMRGISNNGKNPTDPYATAGDRAYLIGTQDGNFPDQGEHLAREMGGLWVHPIKLIDGFEASVADSAAGQEAALRKSEEFINYPYGNRFRYGKVLDQVEIDRFQFAPEGQPGVVVQYILRNRGDQRRELRFRLRVKTDLLPVWQSEKLGITDAPDSVSWQPATRRFLARDQRHPLVRGLGSDHGGRRDAAAQSRLDLQRRTGSDRRLELHDLDRAA